MSDVARGARHSTMHRTTPPRSSVPSPTLARDERNERRALMRIARQHDRVSTRCRSCGSRCTAGREQCSRCNPYCDCDHHPRPTAHAAIVRFVMYHVEHNNTGVMPVSLYLEALAKAFEHLAASTCAVSPYEVAHNAVAWVKSDFERACAEQSALYGCDANDDDDEDIAELSESWDREAWAWMEGGVYHAIETSGELDARLLSAAFYGAANGDREVTGVRWDGNIDTFEVYEYNVREMRHELLMSNIRASLLAATEGGL